jgi:hypothetical protein
MAESILSEPVVAGNPAPAVVHVEFHGFKIPTVMHDGKPHFAIKPICEAIGLDFSGQLRNIKKDPVLGPTMVNLTTVADDGKQREMAFLPVHFFNGWIFKIDANRYVKKTIREALIMYQREGYDVMCAYFNRGIAINPRVLETSPGGPTMSGTLTSSHQQEIKELVQAKASAYPDAVKRKVFSQIWTRLQRKFKVPRYEELPVAVFGEARDYVIAMQIRGAEPEAITGETPRALPGAASGCSIRDYAWFYPGLPETPDVWRRLSFRAADAFEKFGKEIDAIKAEAFKPFRENRRSGVATFFDEAMSPNHALFKIVDDQMRVAYRCVYEALDGLIATYALLRKG